VELVERVLAAVRGLVVWGLEERVALVGFFDFNVPRTL
jgi:hypothetical protein